MKWLPIVTLTALANAFVFTQAPAEAASQTAPSTLRIPILTVAPELTGDGGWNDAAHTTIGWDFTNHRAAVDPASVDIAAAGSALYVRFSVHQRQPVTATQALDNVGENSDDYVTVRLWPSGQTRLAYDFRANPHGVHYQASSENANFAPGWTSIARQTTDGYIVAMLIPLKTMRSDGRPVWRAQFETRSESTPNG